MIEQERITQIPNAVSAPKLLMAGPKQRGNGKNGPRDVNSMTDSNYMKATEAVRKLDASQLRALRGYINSLMCPHCNGIGQNHMIYGWVNCRYCDGTGEKK